MKEGLFTFVSAIAVQKQNWPLTRLIKPACALATSYRYPSYSSSIHPFQLCFPVFSGVGLNFSCIYCLSFLLYLHLSCLLGKNECFFFNQLNIKSGFLFIPLFLHISIVKFFSVHVNRKSFIHLNTLMQCPMLLIKKYDGLTFVSQTPFKFIF